jgi:hypothetical protein
MRMQAHFKLSKPYLNKKTLRFERKVLSVGGQQCIPSSYANVTMIRRDVFDDVYYYPFNFNPRNNTWYGKSIGTAGEEYNDWTYYKIKDYKFGAWYKEHGELIVKPLFEQRDNIYKKEFIENGGDKLTDIEIKILKQIRFKHGSVSGLNSNILQELVSKGFVGKQGIIFHKYYLMNKGNIVLNKILFNEKHYR